MQKRRVRERRRSEVNLEKESLSVWSDNVKRESGKKMERELKCKKLRDKLEWEVERVNRTRKYGK